MADLKYERKLYKQGITLIGGVDEAGRGPLAGPVVAACVIMPKDLRIKGLNDSKKISTKKREEYYHLIKEHALSIGIGIISAQKIDEINIYQATIQAMQKAISKSRIPPEHLLIDAMKLDTPIPSTSIIKGDELSQSIAAASIIAKVTRDQLMASIDSQYPKYNLKKHKGYGTKEHKEMIRKHGICPEHRQSFKMN